MHAAAALPADLESFLQRLDHPVAFVAHVGDVQLAVALGDAAQLNQLLGGGGARRRIEGPGGDTDRAFAQGLVQKGGHDMQLGLAGRLGQVVQRIGAQGGLADQAGGVDRRRLGGDAGVVFAVGAEDQIGAFGNHPQLFGQVLGPFHRRDGKAAVAVDDGGHP